MLKKNILFEKVNQQKEGSHGEQKIMKSTYFFTKFQMMKKKIMTNKHNKKEHFQK
jgi:hypothetical protein